MKKIYSLLLLAGICLFGAQNVMAQTWTVAGSSEAVFGSTWNPAYTANDMTDENSDGIFEFVKEGVTLAAGTVSFKVCKDHAWTEAYPAQDYNLSIPEGGVFTITITFNSDTKAVNATADLQQAVDILPTVKLAGDFTEWESGAFVFTVDDGDLTASYHWNSTSDKIGSKELKLIVGDAWQTVANRENWITRVNNADNFTVTGGENNNTYIDLDMVGEYVFTYTFATQQLSITYPQTYTRHFDNAYYSTICLPQAATLTNATAYEIATINVAGGYISLSEPVANLVAGKPYIILPSADNVDVTATMSGDPVSNTVAGANGLWGVLNIGGEGNVSDGNYILSENQFCLVSGGSVNVPRFRGALWVDAGGDAPALRVVAAENGATAIDNIEANETAVKFIENGKLFIRKNGVVYDATGAIVK